MIQNGITLKKARILADLTQADVAKSLEIHPITYSNWEKNPDEISIKNAKKIAKILGRSVDELFFKEEG